RAASFAREHRGNSSTPAFALPHPGFPCETVFRSPIEALSRADNPGSWQNAQKNSRSRPILWRLLLAPTEYGASKQSRVVYQHQPSSEETDLTGARTRLQILRRQLRHLRLKHAGFSALAEISARRHPD